MSSKTNNSSLKVTIVTLGRFSIEIDKMPLSFGSKVQRKPLELLKVLIALGGEGVSTETLSEALWPDSDGDRAYSAFNSALNRLRKLIGREALSLHDRRLTLNSHLCWVDTQEFTKRLNAASQAIKTGNETNAWEDLKQALSLYQGSFLEGEFDPPEILSAREKLHSLFLRHLEEVGSFFSKNQQVEKAIVLFQEGLEIDDLAEGVYQHLMRCFQQQGRLAEGIAIYQRCREILHARMDIEPSPETEQMHQSLLEDQKRRALDGIPLSVTRDSDTAEETKTLSSRPEPSLSRSERRQITVGFFVLSEYKTISEKLDPEELDELMTLIKTEAKQIVEYHGGIINLSIQDQLVALFGVPTAHEDDPVRAVRAALELYEWLDRIRPEIKRNIGIPLHIHSGLSTGLAVAHWQNDQEGSYDITGNVVTVGAQLSEQAKPDEILLSEETNRLIIPFVDTELLKPFKLVGVSKPLAAYRAKHQSKARSRPVETRFEASRIRGFTPFTGRKFELETLHNKLEKAFDGEGQFVTVVGEAGVGKSRLCYEFTRTMGSNRMAASPTSRSSASHGMDPETESNFTGPRPMVLGGRCQSYGSETPYLPFTNALRKQLGLLEGDSPKQLLEKVVTQIKAMEPALEQYLPLYLNLLSIRNEEYPLPKNLQGPELASAFQEALSTLFILIAKIQPVVLILEDWHWSDGASQAALKHLLSMIDSHSLMLMVLYRPEFIPTWGNPSHHTLITLNPLGIDYSEDIVKAALKVNRLPAGLAVLIHERTSGNPFFIEEVCTALIEEGYLSIKKGLAELVNSLDQITLPDTVQAVIQTRLDKLTPHLRETLGLASVIGREFTRNILLKVSPDPTHLSSILEELKALELIRQTQLLPEAAFRFRHFLTREVAYDTLLLRQRKALHEQVGNAIESQFSERLEERYEDLAYHYQLSSDLEKALHYLELAGDKAAGYFSLLDARNYYKIAIDLIDGVRYSEATLRTHEKAEWQRVEMRKVTSSGHAPQKRKRVEISLKWAQISQFAEPEMYPSMLIASLDDAKDLNDKLGIARLFFWLGVSSYRLGDYNQAIEYFSNSSELASQLKEKALVAESYGFLGLVYFSRAEFTKGKEFYEHSIGLFEGTGNQEQRALFVGRLGVLLAQIGDFEKALTSAKKELEISERTGNLTNIESLNIQLSLIYNIQGNWQASINAGVQAIETSRQTGNAITTGMGTAQIGYARFMLNDQEEGIHSICEGIQTIENTGSTSALTLFYCSLAECYALTGQVKQAIDAANHSLQLTIGQRVGEAKAYQALAMAMAQESSADPKKIDETMQKSLQLARERGQHPFLSIGYFRYAKILADDRRETGNRQEAQEYLNQATELFSKMKMTWWLEQTETFFHSLSD